MTTSTDEYRIAKGTPQDYPRLMAVWEASVRATHDFLQEGHIEMFRPIILEKAFPAVELFVLRNASDVIVAFAGVADGKQEMLFVDPAEFGKGHGKKLLLHVQEKLGVRKVDVNEQNEQACSFYRHMGYEVAGRSATDGLGLPYPLLHLELR